MGVGAGVLGSGLRRADALAPLERGLTHPRADLALVDAVAGLLEARHRALLGSRLGLRVAAVLRVGRRDDVRRGRGVGADTAVAHRSGGRRRRVDVGDVRRAAGIAPAADDDRNECRDRGEDDVLQCTAPWLTSLGLAGLYTVVVSDFERRTDVRFSKRERSCENFRNSAPPEKEPNTLVFATIRPFSSRK
mgnify:CR=1 FL=1